MSDSIQLRMKQFSKTTRNGAVARYSSWQKGLAVLVISSAAMCSVASAQPALLTNFPELKKSDLQAMRQARKKVTKLEVGQSSSWQNTDTGNSGKISLIKKESLNNHDCQKIVYELKAVEEAKKRTYETWTCKVDKKWKLLTDKEVKQFRAKS